MYDLIIRNGTLVLDEGLLQADLAVAEGLVAALGPELAGAARETIDATGLHVVPGLIDAHVHFNDPGRADWEGWATGSRALAAGGGTCCCEMPLNASPPTLDAASFALKLEAASAASVVDFALWGGLTPTNLGQLDELAACGVIALKAFMSSSGTDDFQAADDLTLYEGMRAAARLGLLVAVHAESETLTARLAARARAEHRTGIRDYLASRPVLAELEAIARAIFFAEQSGCALHIVHISSGQGARLAIEARSRGVDVSWETCPHYLVLSEDDVEALGAVAKCAPPLRDRATQQELWEHLLRDRAACLIASDHSPAPPDMKRSPDFFQVWGGIAGCQSTLPLLLDAWARRGLDLPAVAALCAGNVARRFAIAGKGRIAPGYDADLALVELGAEQTLEAEDLLYRHRLSPYLGRRTRGRVARTILRGRTVFLDGKIATQPGQGRFVKRNIP
jgi:allantoinase